MALQSIRVRPPNSLVLVMDDRTGVVPDDTGARVAATASCVTIATAIEVDDETTVRMSGPEDFVPDPELALAWAGRIITDGVLDVATSHAEVLLSMDLPVDRRPVVSVWTNDDSEPDVVWIVVDQGRPIDPPSSRALSLARAARTRLAPRGRRR